jgi:hypothetical protein
MAIGVASIAWTIQSYFNQHFDGSPAITVSWINNYSAPHRFMKNKKPCRLAGLMQCV